MSRLGTGDDAFDIEVAPLAAVGLIKRDLQLATDVVILEAGVLFARDENVDPLRLIVADGNGAPGMGGKSMTHFVGEFRRHGSIIAERVGIRNARYKSSV